MGSKTSLHAYEPQCHGPASLGSVLKIGIDRGLIHSFRGMLETRHSLLKKSDLKKLVKSRSKNWD